MLRCGECIREGQSLCFRIKAKTVRNLNVISNLDFNGTSTAFSFFINDSQF